MMRTLLALPVVAMTLMVWTTTTTTTNAFVVPPPFAQQQQQRQQHHHHHHHQLNRQAIILSLADSTSEETTAAADNNNNNNDEVPRNPDRPELPALKGDFDWDEAYKQDEDWLTGESVPGKMRLNEIELAEQVTELTKLEEKWRAERVEREYQGSNKVGFVPGAETLNGRLAMFFLVTGLLTELWTGQTMPQQVEEMLRIAGVIGFDG